MRAQTKNIEKLLRDSIEYKLLPWEVDYFTRSLSLTPLKVIMYSLAKDSIENKIELVLDGGCGIGLFSILMHSGEGGVSQHSFSIVGIDIDLKRLRIATALLKRDYRSQFLQASIGDLPFRDGVFQATFVHDVFQHVDLGFAIFELTRVSSNLMYFDIPNKLFYSAFPSLKPNPYLTYDRVSIKNKLLSLGFGVGKILPAPLVFLTRRLSFPAPVARALFAFLLALPALFRNLVSALWPLVLFRTQRIASADAR